MRLIPTKIHGYLDYAAGVVLILSPWLFGFASGGLAQWHAVAAGAVLIAYSLLTDYEVGASPMIPVPTHLGIDMAGGAILIVAPFLLGYAAISWLPQVVLGVGGVLVALLTRTRREDETIDAAGGI